MQLDRIVQMQRDFFNTNETKSVAFRKNQLKKLTEAIEEYKIVQYNYLFGGMSRLDEYYMVPQEETP